MHLKTLAGGNYLGTPGDGDQPGRGEGRRDR